MKKNLTNYAIKLLGLTVLVFIVMIKPAFCQEPAIDNDLITYSMTVSPGQQVKFRLPLDIRTGDMITGSVVEENKNNTGKGNKNSSTLEGTVIEIDGKQTKISNRLISFLVPAGLTSLPFLLKNSAGEIIERGQIPINILSSHPIGADLSFSNILPDNIHVDKVTPVNVIKFSPEPVGQPGQALRVTGTFDGNAANTNVSLNGQTCETIAESPRENFIQVSQNATTGVSNLTIQENNTTEEHKINIAILNLSASKTNLRKGGEATVIVLISGLGGLEKGTDCKVDITNLSPSIVSFKGTTGNNINKTIPQRVTGDYKFNFSIVGVTQGNFALEGILYCSSNSNANQNQAIANVGPEYQKWQEKLKEALRKRMLEEGFTADEVGKMIKDSFKGIWGIIKNLKRLYKMKRAIDKAYEDAGPKPDKNK